MLSNNPYFWYASSDQAISAQIGEFIKHSRLQQNKTQAELSHQAGISRSTLSLLERGETVTLSTLIQVLRSLEKLEVLTNFTVQQELSPMMVAEMEMKYRKRARKKGTNEDPKPLEW